MASQHAQWILKSIEDTFEKNEKKIQEKAETANDEESLMKYHVFLLIRKRFNWNGENLIT